jgi:PAS domain S-box-containing protein
MQRPYSETNGLTHSWPKLLDALPAAIYTTDHLGRLLNYNPAAASFWGQEPALLSTLWCGSWRLYWPDGTPMRHDACPLAVALQTGRAIRGMEAVAERPDGVRIPFLAFPTPVFSDDYGVVGAINMLVDITAQKRTERSLKRRMAEQAALHALTDRLHRAQSLGEVFSSALDAICGALQCDRASILLFDDAGLMRFVGWRGLSDFYRRAVEGHSPWSTRSIEPDPILVPNVPESALPDDLKGVIAAERIEALAFIPLVSDGRLVGKFMAYFDTPHLFAREEVEIAVTIGRQLGFAVERLRTEEARARVEQELRYSERRLKLALDAGRMGAWEWDICSGRVHWSQGLERIHGLEPGTFGGTFEEFKADIHPADLERVLASIERSISSRSDHELLYRIVRRDGAIRWLQAYGKIELGPNGDLARLTGICMDVTEREEHILRIHVLMREVNHRSKNLLSLVQTVAKHTIANSAESFLARFSERLRGLAASQDLLVKGEWSGIDLDELVRSQLSHFEDLLGKRIAVEGPTVVLTAFAAQTLGMAINELATNAGKYGALSTETGRIDIRWSYEAGPDGARRLRLRWQERGGPPVCPPERQGFGSTVLGTIVRRGLEAETHLEYAPEGIVWVAECPAVSLLEGGFATAARGDGRHG